MSLGTPELIVIFVLVLLLFGPNRLPELTRGLGKGLREIRKVTSEFQNQLNVLAEHEEEPPRRTPRARAYDDGNRAFDDSNSAFDDVNYEANSYNNHTTPAGTNTRDIPANTNSENVNDTQSSALDSSALSPDSPQSDASQSSKRADDLPGSRPSL